MSDLMETSCADALTEDRVTMDDLTKNASTPDLISVNTVRWTP
jgi:hypothetical protein